MGKYTAKKLPRKEVKSRWVKAETKTGPTETIHLWQKHSPGYNPKAASDKAVLTARHKSMKISLAPIPVSKEQISEAIDKASSIFANERYKEKSI